MTDDSKKSRSRLTTGAVLIAASYGLMIPGFLFVSLGIAKDSSLWYGLAGSTYILSWILFIAGLLMAGPDAARLARRQVLSIFKRKKETIDPTEEVEK